MLELKDFYLLPQLQPLVKQLVEGWVGLGIIAGADPRPLVGEEPYPPSGHASLFRILLRDTLLATPTMRATVVRRTGDGFRLPRALRRRVSLVDVASPGLYGKTIDDAVAGRPDLLVVDRLTSDSCASTLSAAASGLRVLSQLDTVLRGAEVVRLLYEMGSCHEHLGSVVFVMAVQRLATLCPRCRSPVSATPSQLRHLRSWRPDLAAESDADRFYHALGCSYCGTSGRAGEVAAFEVRWLDPAASRSRQAVSLSMEEYLLELAQEGYLALDDVLDFDAELLRRTCRLLAATERTLENTHTRLVQKTTELGAASAVLQQRTEALIALEGIGQALVVSTSLEELAQRLCRNARDICRAERAVLYYRGASEPSGGGSPPKGEPAPLGSAQILACVGWEPGLVNQPVDEALLFGDDGLPPDASAELTAFDGWPPGVPPSRTDITASTLRAGLRVPLVAHDKLVGLLIVHTTEPRGFSPGAVALLQTFANQAAVAIQRASLVDELQEKIGQLEKAQAQLVHKERMERELELARQVQQSVLPRTFPHLPGLAFAAKNEPARQVGGDFYDVFLLDSTHVGLIVGDVSGKGMPAALYMARAHSLLRAEVRRLASLQPERVPSAGLPTQHLPRTALSYVHRLLQELGESETFVTVFLGVLDVLACRLAYTRAGHERPLLLRAGQVHPLRGEGTVLGFPGLDDLLLSEESVDLFPGDRLFLYTDGLADAVSQSGASYGRNRLEALVESSCSLSAQQLCRQVFAAIGAFQDGVEQYDDMTLLVVGVDELPAQSGSKEGGR